MEDEAFTGEIRLCTYDFIPMNWLACDGAEYPINTYSDLYAVIGISYGGNPPQTFCVPDLRGVTAMGAQERWDAGLKTGAASVVITSDTIPTHTHTVNAVKTAPANLAANPAGKLWANANTPIYAPETDSTYFSPNAISGFTGGEAAHNNIQPCLGLQYIICYSGVFPTPSQS